jgi:raffinose/stachyose/melibiose transport system substrate-binding protein
VRHSGTSASAIRVVAAALLAFAVLAVSCTSGSSSDGKTTVVFWWWGKDEAPGLDVWLKETVAKFEAENPEIAIELVEQTTDGLVQAAQAAQAAQKGPDIQYYWPVGWLQDDIFNQRLAALDELLPDEVGHYLPAYRNYATWNGHVYAAPFYSIGNPFVYRKDLFAKAGLDPEKPPTTFAEFMQAGEKLKAAGITPIAAGMKDQWYADWPTLITWVACGYDNVSQWFDAFLGKTPGGLTAAAQLQMWDKLYRTIKAEFYPRDVMDLTLYEGFNLFLQGKAAIATPVGPTSVQWARELGPDKVGVMLTPCQNESKLGSQFPDATEWVAIPAFAEHKEEAAKFIAFMHTPERMAAMFKEAGALAGDDRLSISDTDPVSQQIIDWSQSKSYFALYYTAPPTVDEWVWPNVGNMFTGDLTPQAAAAVAQDSNQQWLENNPQLKADFDKWEDSLTATSGT